jgi:hypothetical protein
MEREVKNMNIKGFFSKFIEVVVAGVKKIVGLVMEAEISSIAKAGLFIGSVAVGYVLSTKILKSNYNHMKNTANASPVDEALALNFADKRNQNKINPILSEIKKSLSSKKEIRKNNTKKKFDKKKLHESISHLKSASRVASYNHQVLSELEKFERDMEEIELNDLNDVYFENNFALRQAWNNA